MDRSCKTCDVMKPPSEFYIYAKSGKCYANCKKCHNQTRQKYTRNRPVRSITTTQQLPSGEIRLIQVPHFPPGLWNINSIFDLVNRASEALSVQAEVNPSDAHEVELGSS